MNIVKEFKEFAVKGNAIDMAVGIVIGAAFGKIVTSLVTDVITPPLGLLVGGVDFTNLAITLRSAQGTAVPVVLRYGVFIQTIFDFVVVAFSIFVLVRALNALRRDKADAAPQPPAQDLLLLAEIRDILKDKSGRA